MFESMSSAPLAAGTALIGAIAVATLVTILLPGVPAVKAEPQIEAATQLALVKADRLPLAAKGAACSSRGWPNYEAVCQFDMRRPAGDTRTVRVIALR
jgi:hypothetical protein